MTKRIIVLFMVITGFLAGAKGYAQPIASFTIDSTNLFCNPMDVYFSSTSTGSGLSYSWNFGVVPGVNATSTNPTYVYPQCGTFTVTLTVTDFTGKQNTITQQVLIHCTPFVQFVMADSTVCQGGTVWFKDASRIYNPVVTWSWNFGDTLSSQDTASGLQPSHVYNKSGVYTVTETLTSPYGCKESATHIVTVSNSSVVTAGPDVSICSDASAQLNASGSSQYSWLPSAGLSATNIPNPVAQPQATTTYTVTATNLSGCTGSAQVVINVTKVGTLNAGTNQTVCTGSSANLDATGLSNYTWSPATGLSATDIPNPVATPSSTQSYVVSGTDMNGCNVADTVVVSVYTVPVANAGSNLTICEGDNADLIASGGNSFQWLPASSTLQNANSFHAVASPSVTTTYSLVVSNGGNCSATSEVVVTVNPKPTITAPSSIDYCPGSTLQLNAGNGGISYAWSPATGLNQTDISNPVVTPMAPVTYTVSTTDTNGCSATATVEVDTKIPLNMVTSPGGTVCLGEQIQLNTSGAISYKWSPATSLDDPYIASPYASPKQDITYKVKGTDGCYFDSSYVEIKVSNAPNVKTAGTLQTFANDPIQLLASGAGSFTWTPSEGLTCSDCSDPTATVSVTTTYTVDLVNTDGCRSEDEVVVLVNCNSDLVFIPNAFTPNGDGKDDVFYIRTTGLKKLEVFKVFTRTGVCVFQTTDVDEGWDGTCRGEKLPPGVFSYYGEAVCSQNEEVTFTGNVTLIR